MTIPHYAPSEQECEYCRTEIYIGYEAIFYDDCLFCDRHCLINHVAELKGAKVVTLTDDKTYKGVD